MFKNVLGPTLLEPEKQEAKRHLRLPGKSPARQSRQLGWGPRGPQGQRGALETSHHRMTNGACLVIPHYRATSGGLRDPLTAEAMGRFLVTPSTEQATGEPMVKPSLHSGQRGRLW